MAIQLQGQVGPQTLTDGALASVRLGKSAEIVQSPLHAHFYEMASRGNLFYGATASSGVAPGTSIGTTAAFALYNPAGSGKNLVVVRASLGYISGTLGAGTIYWCGNTNTVAAATTGTAITPVAGNLASQATSVGQPLTTATLPASPKVLFPAFNLTALLATTAVQPYTVQDMPDGSLIVGPGSTLSLEGVAAAGTSPLVAFGICWVEWPV